MIIRSKPFVFCARYLFHSKVVYKKDSQQSIEQPIEMQTSQWI